MHKLKDVGFDVVELEAEQSYQHKLKDDGFDVIGLEAEQSYLHNFSPTKP